MKGLLQTWASPRHRRSARGQAAALPAAREPGWRWELPPPSRGRSWGNAGVRRSQSGGLPLTRSTLQLREILSWLRDLGDRHVI